MKIAVTGPIDGNILHYYDNLKNKGVDWLLCTGDFGVWPDPARIDRATRQKNPNQDFAKLYIDDWSAPVQTLFVAGVHEDQQRLDRRFKDKHTEVLENVFWLANGFKTHIGDLDATVRVTGLGKAYSEKTFRGEYTKKSPRHYTRKELERGCASGPTDILLLHTDPSSEGIRNLCFATRPRIIFYHSKRPESGTIQNTPAYGIVANQTLLFDYSEEKIICLNEQ